MSSNAIQETRLKERKEGQRRLPLDMQPPIARRHRADYQALRSHLAELRAERVVLTRMSAAMLARLTNAVHHAAYDCMVIDL